MRSDGWRGTQARFCCDAHLETEQNSVGVQTEGVKEKAGWSGGASAAIFNVCGSSAATRAPMRLLGGGIAARRTELTSANVWTNYVLAPREARASLRARSELPRRTVFRNDDSGCVLWEACRRCIAGWRRSRCVCRGGAMRFRKDVADVRQTTTAGALPCRCQSREALLVL